MKCVWIRQGKKSIYVIGSALNAKSYRQSTSNFQTSNKTWLAQITT